MRLEQAIHQYQAELTALDKEILAYVLANKEAVSSMKIIDLAEQCHTSKSSILRLVQKLEFAGFAAFKYHLKEEHSVDRENVVPTVDGMKLQSQDFTRTQTYLNSIDMRRLLHDLQQAKLIYCYATTLAQQQVCRVFAQQMLQLSRQVIVIEEADALRQLLPQLTVTDFLIVVAQSQEVSDFLLFNFQWERQKVPTLAVTNFGKGCFDFPMKYLLCYYITPLNQDGVCSLLPLQQVFDFLVRRCCLI